MFSPIWTQITTHTFQLTDNCGNQFTVTSPPRYNLSVTTTRACPFSTITATIECGLPTTFVLRDASNVIVASNTTGIFTGLAPATYTLTATAANGDYVLSKPVDLTVPNFIPFQWGVTMASIEINGICEKYWKLTVNQSYVISGGTIYHTTLADYCLPDTYLLHSNVYCRDTTIILPPFPQMNLTANVTAGCQGNTGTVVLQGAYSYANWLSFGIANNVNIWNYTNDNYQMDYNSRTLNSTFLLALRVRVCAW